MEENRRALLTGGMLFLHLGATLAVSCIHAETAVARMLLSAFGSAFSLLLPLVFAKTVGFSRVKKQPKTTLPALALFIFSVALISAGLQLNVFLCDALGIRNASALTLEPGGASAVLAVLCYAIIPAVCEELFYRHLLFDVLGGGRRAVVMTALCFAVSHFNLNGLVYTLIAGIVLGLCVLLRGGVDVSIAAHIAVNTVVLGLSYAEKLSYATYSLISSLTWSLIFGAGAVMAVYCYLGYGQAELARIANSESKPDSTQNTLHTLILPLVYIVALILWQLVRIVL